MIFLDGLLGFIIALFNQLFLFFNKGDLLFVFRNDSCTLVEIITILTLDLNKFFLSRLQ